MVHHLCSIVWTLQICATRVGVANVGERTRLLRWRIDEMPPVFIRVTRGHSNCLSRVITSNFLRVDPDRRTAIECVVTTAGSLNVTWQNERVCLRISLSPLVSRFYVTDAGPDASACSRRRGADALSSGTVETHPLPRPIPSTSSYLTDTLTIPTYECE